MNNRFTRLSKVLVLAMFTLFSFHDSLLAQNCDNSNPYFNFTYAGPDTFFVGTSSCTAVLDWEANPPSIVPDVAVCGVGNISNCVVNNFETNMMLTTVTNGQTLHAGVTATIYYQFTGMVDSAGTILTITDNFCFEIKIIETIAPVFTDATPLDIPVSCMGQIPTATTLNATDNCDDSFPKAIVAVDSPIGNPCAGGVIARTWTATDSSGQSTSVTQTITLAADTEKPKIGTPPVSATVDCAVANYAAWLTIQKDNVDNTSTDNCGIASITDNAPATFPDHCDQVDVIFTVTDNCGNDSIVNVFYKIEDNTPPVLTGITAANDTLNLSCSDIVLAAPAITATDNCTPNLTAALTETTTQVVDGSCTEFSYQITRAWIVEDSCGNITRDTQIVIVKDNTNPTFDVFPKDTIINCMEITTPSNTGEPTVSDNCDTSPLLVFADTVLDTFSTCTNAMLIKRNWTLTDTCGNTVSMEQLIMVQDTTPPSFVVPADTIIGCSFGTDPMITGQPTGMADICDATPELTHTDVQTAGSCTNEFTITRTWTLTDTCGNIFNANQVISVIDTFAPVITSDARDSVYTCDGTGTAAAFTAWISANGRAIATDNCAGAMTWQAFNAGTTDPAALVAKNCAATAGVVRTQSVDFVVFDACGLKDTTTAQFTEIDNMPPTITNCPSDISMANDPGLCGATISFNPPRFEDECFDNVQTLNLAETLNITSSGVFGDPNVIVNTMDFNLAVANPSASIVGVGVTFKVTLTNVDAEVDSSEYFNVFAEDGSLLGRTTQVIGGQCGSGETDFTINDKDLLYSWMADGVISFRLEPRVPNGAGRDAINNICPNGSVSITTSFDANISNDIIYEYTLDGSARQRIDPVAAFTQFLNVGAHDVEYFVTDCAGNTDSCDYTIIVNDTEAPTMTCPTDVAASTEAGICTTDLTLELPNNAGDNCGLPNAYAGTAPAAGNDRFLTFYSDPNLGDYLAEDKTITFTGLTGNASGSSAILTVRFLADMDNSEGYFTVLGEDGSTLGTTREGQANVIAGDCTNEGRANFVIPDATLNAWATDGMVTITLVSNNNILIPPGGPGSGINPCNAAAVTANGDSDNMSQVWADLNFNQITPTYFATGATDIIPQTYGVGHNATHTFNVGTTDVSYVIEDIHGNKDTCTYQIEVTDNERPVATCMPTVIRINPSGTVQGAIDPLEIGSASTDNCGITSLVVEPSIVTCNDFDTTIDVDLIVEDFNGNKDTCSTFVRIEGEEPMPSFGYTCGSDTLFLFANPPTSSSTNSYTYRWFGPSGALISTEENPEITASSLIQAGSYCVEIEGLTGCTSTGCLNIPLDLRPPQPTMQGPSLVCWDTDDITLTSTPPPGFTGAVTYNWYAGTFPNGTVLSNTSTPSFLIAAPHTLQPDEEENRCYYVTITINGCESQPSNVLCMDVVRPPLAQVRDQSLTLCEGEPLQLFSTNTQNVNCTFDWTGPSFDATNAEPVVTNSLDPNVHAGNYELVVLKKGCPSEKAVTIVNVLDVPNGTPNLSPLTQDICVGNDLTLTTNLTGVTTYRWVPPVGNEISTIASTLNLTATSAHHGAWKVYGVVAFTNPNTECSTTMSEAVVVNVNTFTENIIATSSPSQVCDGGDVRLQASPVLAGATYEWKDSEGTRVGVGADFTLQGIRKVDEGIYTLTVTNAAGCVKTSFVQVSVAQGVRVTGVTNNAPACFSGSAMVKLSAIVSPADDGTYQYLWEGPNSFQGSDSLQVLNIVDFNTSRGTYSLKVTNGQGCESNIGTTVVDGQAPVSTPNVTVNAIDYCVGDDVMLTATGYSGQNVTYTWFTPTNGTVTTVNDPTLEIVNATETATGSYFVTVNVDGCDSDISGVVQINVNPVPTAFPTAIVPCEGGTLLLSGNYFPAGGTTTFEWNTPNGDYSSQNPPIENADPDVHNGNYTLTVTRDGCESNLGDVNIQITAAPTMPFGLTVDPICLNSGESMNLCVDPNASEVGATYIWTNQAGDTIGTTTNLCLEITDLSAYNEAGSPFAFFVTTLKNGCTSENPQPITVSFNSLPTFNANAGTDFILCDGAPLMLNAVVAGGENGTWRYLGSLPGVNIAMPNASTTAVTGLPAGSNYDFSWSLNNGACESYSVDTINVTVYALETPNAGIDIDTCNTDTFFLRAEPSLSGLGRWEQSTAQAALGVTIIDIADPNTAVTVLVPNPDYFFNWVIPNQVCGGSTDQVRVNVGSPNAFAGMDFDECGLGEGVLLTANAVASGIGEWTSPDANVEFTDMFEPTTTVDNLSDGENIFIWTTDNGLCGDGSIDTVIVNYSASPMAMNDVVAVPYGGVATFEPADNDPFATDFLISIKNMPTQGLVDDTNDDVFTYSAPLNFIGTDSMVYEICPTNDDCDCTQATVYFNVGGEIADCQIPSIFTPNGDSKNEFFNIGCLADEEKYPLNELVIFNQWGDEVHRASPYRNDWYGTFNDDELPAGTYFYFLDLRTGDEPMTGFLIIQR